MLHVVICEDGHQERKRIEKIVSKHIEAAGVNMELVLSTGTPLDVLDYIKAHPDRKGLYFLDVDLQHDINGIELATQIKEEDSSAKIVFITTKAEMYHLVFQHKIEALDYIIKDRPEDIEQRTIECAIVAYQRYLDGLPPSERLFTVEEGGEIWHVPHDEILFFETNPDKRNKVNLYTQDKMITFRSTISGVATIGSEFFQCHKCFVVNTTKIKRIDKNTNEIEMMNGDIVTVAAKKMSTLVKMIGDR